MRSSIFNFEVLVALGHQPLRPWAWWLALLAGGVVTYGFAAYGCFWFEHLGKIDNYRIRYDFVHETPRQTVRTMAVDRLGPTIETLLMGSSHIDCGVQPEVFSEPVMSLNLHDGGYELFEQVLYRNRERVPNLQRLVLELDPSCFVADRLSKSRDYRELYEIGLGISDLPRPWWWKIQQATLESRWVHSVIFGRRWSPYRHQYVVSQRVERAAHRPVTKRYPGHVAILIRMTEEEMDRLQTLDLRRDMPERNLARNEAALHRIIAWTRREEVELIFLTVPHWQGYDRYRQGDWVSWYRGVLDRLQQKLGADFRHWDDFQLPAIPVDEFSDVQHLNKWGAERYSRLLDERLHGGE